MSEAVTKADIERAGPEAVAMMITLMQRNEAESAAIRQSLIDSLQRDLEAAWAELAAVRASVQTVLHRPHTDYMIESALFPPYAAPGKGAEGTGVRGWLPHVGGH